MTFARMERMTSRLFWRALGLVALIVTAGTVYSQSYPSKPIRIITDDPGGNADRASRTIAQGITQSLGQPIIVENRTTIAAIETVMKALPDGYTLLYGASTFIYGPLVRKMFYHPTKDFVPVSMLTRQPSVVVVHPALPVGTIKELIVLAKAKPGDLIFASIGVGSASHLAVALFTSMAGINLLHVPYKGSGAASTDLLAGRVHLRINSAQSVIPFVKSGKLKALAVTTAEPSVLVPWLPTVASAGLPGYHWESTNGIFAPRKTPPSIVNRLNQAMQRALSSSEIKEKYLASGAETINDSAAAFGERLKSEVARLTRVIKEAGIKEADG